MSLPPADRHPAMRVVMTGGGSFIGSHLLVRMVGAGMSVTLIGPDTGESRYTASLVHSGAVRLIQCDRSFPPDRVRTALDEADALVLLSGEMSPVPLARLVRAFAHRGKHVILGSSDAVYGSPARNPVRECDPTDLRTELGLAMLACETAVRVCSGIGTTASILRYGALYGPGETAQGTIPKFIRAALAGQPPALDGDGSDERDYVHVADAVDATMAALRERANGVFNVGTGIGTTSTELASLVVWLTDCPGAPVRRPVEATGAHTSLVLDASRARSELQFAPRHSLPEGISEEIGWLKAALASQLTSAA